MKAPTTVFNGGDAHRRGHGVYASTSTKERGMAMPRNVEDAMPHIGSELASHLSRYKCVEQGTLSKHGNVHEDYDYQTPAARSPSLNVSGIREWHKYKARCTRHTRGGYDVGCEDCLENIGNRDIGPPGGRPSQFQEECVDCQAFRSTRYRDPGPLGAGRRVFFQSVYTVSKDECVRCWISKR